MGATTQDSSVESLYWLDELQTDHHSVVSQTALRLSKLAQSEYPVVLGTVLSATALQHFCRSISWSSPFLSDFPHLSLRLPQRQPFQLQGIANEIGQGFKQTSLSSHWLQRCLSELKRLPTTGLIRLSPSLALPQPWAEHTPQLMRMLPIQYCQLTATSVATAIKVVWSSLFTAQTLFLLQESAIPIDQLQLEIVFQPADLAQFSGFLAVTETHLHIQATYGLSEGIISGEVIPDYYAFATQTGKWHKEAGYITCAYQAVSTDGLVSTVLDPSPETPFVLGAEVLEELLILGQDLSQSDAASPVVEWMMPATEVRELKIVSAWTETPFPMPSLANPLAAPSHIEETNDQALAQGLAAAVGQVTAAIVVLKDHHQVQPQKVAGQIVVVDQVVPADLGWLQQAAGLICMTGGYTSHGAIMARELGLPAIVLASALEILQSGQMVLLDGAQGKVYPAPSPQLRATTLTTSPPELDQAPLKTQVWVNLSQSRLLQRALQLPAQGVGLLRAEWFILDICQGQLPTDWIRQQSAAQFVTHLSQHLQPFVEAWQPYPVFYRSLDIKNEALAQSSSSSSPNQVGHSILGLRGTAYYVYDSTLFDLELQALGMLCQQGCQNLRLILPFVRSVEEFQFCRDRIRDTGLLDTLQIWMMAEVPAVLFQLPEYVAAGLQGIAIGTNDLTQLLLGVDRDHPYLTQKYSANHPAVLAAMSQLVETAQRLGIPCSICGQAPVHHPQLIERFVAWGVTAVSVEMAAVAATRVEIATAEQRLGHDPAFKPSTTQNS